MKPLQDAVMVIGGGTLQLALVREAQVLGLVPLVTDGNPHAPAFRLPGAQSFVLSTMDVDGHRELMRDLLRQYRILGVCTAGADVAPTVAAAAEVVGTPGIPFDVAERTHHKLAMRSCLTLANLHQYQPAYCWRTRQEIACIAPDHMAASILAVLDLPVIIKPLSQRASRGITIIHRPSEMHTAIQKALDYGGDAVLVEESLTGTEHSIEGIFDSRGDLLWCNIVDRFFDYSSGVPIETGHVNPSTLVPIQQMALQTMFMDVAHALGVMWGPFKIDALVTPEGQPHVLEVTARLSGGYDSQGTSPLTGRHPMRAVLQLACGLPVDAPLTWTPAQGYAACAAILAQKTGIVQAQPPIELNVSQLGGEVHQVIWAIGPGQAVAPARHNGERAGYVLAKAPTALDAWRLAKTAADALAAAVEVS